MKTYAELVEMVLLKEAEKKAANFEHDQTREEDLLNTFHEDYGDQQKLLENKNEIEPNWMIESDSDDIFKVWETAYDRQFDFLTAGEQYTIDDLFN